SKLPTPAPPNMLLKALGRSPEDRDGPALSGWEKDPPALLSNSASLSRFWYPAMASNPKSAVIDGISRLIVLPPLHWQGRFTSPGSMLEIAWNDSAVCGDLSHHLLV